ncbi:MAG: leucine-rich repeat domain-containing protein [Eubacterium sp.]|nr:leucine-rich repeat domain-containing protein [Eubacterium sp.]MDD7209150.1 leucine-rich repeat protein [Lachnospiraceae bacterium]MDY5498324.1 leucine-rich repeat protein [Anaerobutyricum sp.]
MNTDSLCLLWQPAKDGIRLLRCFGNSPELILPDSIEQKNITEIGAYCFSRSRPRFQGNVFLSILPGETICMTDSLLNSPDFDFSMYGTELDGTFLEKITLPDCVTTLDNAAFYNCRKLKSLSVGPFITGIGSDEFTNDTKLGNLIIRGSIHQATGLSLFLERIADNLTITFLPDKKMPPEAVLFFPEYYEWLDEISPAHIFSRSIHGEGFRMRKCFQNNILDFGKYDACFANALKSESDETLCKIALNRLIYPVNLPGGQKENYEKALRERLETAFELSIQDKNFSLLSFLCSRFSPDTKLLSPAIESCIRADWGEGSAFLMEQKHKNFTAKTFDFNLDF